MFFICVVTVEEFSSLKITDHNNFLIVEINVLYPINYIYGSTQDGVYIEGSSSIVVSLVYFIMANSMNFRCMIFWLNN